MHAPWRGLQANLRMLPVQTHVGSLKQQHTNNMPPFHLQGVPWGTQSTTSLDGAEEVHLVCNNLRLLRMTV